MRALSCEGGRLLRAEQCCHLVEPASMLHAASAKGTRHNVLPMVAPCTQSKFVSSVTMPTRLARLCRHRALNDLLHYSGVLETDVWHYQVD